jgi:hypothetical protein
MPCSRYATPDHKPSNSLPISDDAPCHLASGGGVGDSSAMVGDNMAGDGLIR